MQGILADANAVGQVEYLVKLMQAEPWADFWQELGLVLRHFDDVGLLAESSDLVLQRYLSDLIAAICCSRNLL